MDLNVLVAASIIDTAIVLIVLVYLHQIDSKLSAIVKALENLKRKSKDKSIEK